MTRPSHALLAIVIALVGSTQSAPSYADLDFAQDESQLIEADRAFAVLTAEKGAEGWASFFHSDAVMFPSEGRVEGRAAIETHMQSRMGPEKPLLRWEPTEAVLAESGEIGWTLGRWQLVEDRNQDPQKILATGNYVTLWRKDVDGEWRVAADIGNNDAAASEEESVPSSHP